ncbi:MAG: undecaprenyl-diphosphatase UppP [Candidatus Paceibacterota bacterium]
MGELLSATILGLVQGITEFLPISSTGHLIIARELLGLQVEYGLAFDAFLHLATALAVLIYFWKDWRRLFFSALSYVQGKGIETKEKVLILALIAGTIPAAVIGFFSESRIEEYFRNVEFVAYALIAGSVLFLIAEWVGKQNEGLSIKKGWWIGFFQALALIPGMSRAGSTIAGGLLFGLSREEAARFAFLLSMPIILGVGGIKGFELFGGGAFSHSLFPILVSAVSAFVAGILSIHFLLKYLRTHTLGIFIVYRVALAIAIFIFI